MDCPEARALQIVRWQLFGTHTLRSDKLTDRVRESIWLAFVRESENVLRVHPRHLLWCRRGEAGELTGRLHFHSLIGGLPSKRVHPGTCFQLMRLWERCGGGHCRMRVFNSEVDQPEFALGYTLKGLSGADIYESARFNSKRSLLTLSESVRRVVRSACSMRDGMIDTGEKGGVGP